MSARDEIKLNKAFMAALEAYSDPMFPFHECYWVWQDPKTGHQTMITPSEAVHWAHTVLENEELMLLKFEHLKRGLRDRGLHHVYERIMGEVLGNK